MRSVQIALISYSPEVHCQVKNACVGAMGYLGGKGYSVSLTERIGDCMIPRARNAVVADFLAGTEDDLIMVDADNFCQPDGFEKLLEADADVVGAPCRGKKEQVTWPIRWLHEDLKIENGLLEVEHVGTGIIRMTRKALQAMADKWPWYRDESCKSGRAPQLFWYEIIDDALWGEDLVFCRRWRELGGKVFILPDVTTWHIGFTAFQGSVSEWLKLAADPLLVDDKGTNSAVFIGNPYSQLPARRWARPQTVTLAMPTRGRMEMAQNTAKELIANSRLANTKVHVGFDRDDTDRFSLPHNPHWVGSLDIREDSLGAKWNRCCDPKADVYVIGVDDVVFGPGWDAAIVSAAAAFDDGLGIVTFADRPDVLQTGLAVCRPLYELMGGFTEEYPVWWVDTWLLEIGRLIGRVTQANVSAKVLNEHKGNSRGIRDVAFWSDYFYRTRPERVQLAKDILLHSSNSPELRRAVIDQMPVLVAEFERTHDNLRDPERARQVEEHFSFDAPISDRYLRIKARAEKHLAEMDLRESYDAKRRSDIDQMLYSTDKSAAA